MSAGSQVLAPYGLPQPAYGLHDPRFLTYAEGFCFPRFRLAV